MHWADVQDYFTNVIQREREQKRSVTGEPAEQFRFAAMCMILGLDPEEGRRRVSSLSRQSAHARPPVRKTLFGA